MKIEFPFEVGKKYYTRSGYEWELKNFVATQSGVLLTFVHGKDCTPWVGTAEEAEKYFASECPVKSPFTVGEKVWCKSTGKEGKVVKAHGEPGFENAVKVDFIGDDLPKWASWDSVQKSRPKPKSKYHVGQKLWHTSSGRVATVTGHPYEGMVSVICEGETFSPLTEQFISDHHSTTKIPFRVGQHVNKYGINWKVIDIDHANKSIKFRSEESDYADWWSYGSAERLFKDGWVEKPQPVYSPGQKLWRKCDGEECYVEQVEVLFWGSWEIKVTVRQPDGGVPAVYDAVSLGKQFSTEEPHFKKGQRWVWPDWRGGTEMEITDAKWDDNRDGMGGPGWSVSFKDVNGKDDWLNRSQDFWKNKLQPVAAKKNTPLTDDEVQYIRQTAEVLLSDDWPNKASGLLEILTRRGL